MGILLSIINQTFPPKTKFTANDVPDLSGKVIIVTGANTGIGKETAKVLLSHNAKVYVAARNPEKAEKAIKDLKEQTGKEALYLKLDLADLKSVKAAAEEFMSKEKELHVLFNNAGVMMCPMDMLTAQGYDLQFGTNVLGHFYFTKLLLPILLSTAKTTPGGKVRVVHTSSMGHLGTSGINFNTLKDSPTRKKLIITPTSIMYAQSKLGNVLFSNELARRYGDEGIVSTAVHPGIIESDLQRHLNFFEILTMKPVMYSTEFGSLNQLYAGTTEEPVDLNGKYIIPWARVGKAGSAAYDTKLQAELWKWMEEQVENV